MSAALLKHTNGIVHVQVKSVNYFLDKIVYECLYDPPKEVCPCCSHDDLSQKGSKVRNLRMAPSGLMATHLSLTLCRLKCKMCEHTWWPRLPFVRGKKRVTQSFEEYVIKLMNFATIKHVSQLLGVSWQLIKEIHKNYLQRTYKPPNLSELEYVGVDEFSISKGHEYMTVFIDLRTSAIIHAVEGKTIASVRPFMELLQREAPQLKAIAMDMNAAYASACRQVLPGVDVVYDRFHVVQLLNKTIEETRRAQQQHCNEAGLRVLKGQRFLLLSNYKKLDATRQSILDVLLRVNEPIALAHSLKEQFQLYWSQSSLQEGASFLGWWIIDAVGSSVGVLGKAARTLLRHSYGLLNYFKHRITNGKTEGVNNKIKTMKRQAYGFRDMVYFKLRLYNLHKSRYSFAR